MCWPMCSLQRLGCHISMQTAAPTTINSPPGSTSKKSRKLSGIAIRPRPAIGTVRWRVDNSRPNICTWLARLDRRPLLILFAMSCTPSAIEAFHSDGFQRLTHPGRSLARTHSLLSSASSSTISAGSERRNRSSSDRVHSPRQRASCLELFSEEVSAIKFFRRAGKPNCWSLSSVVVNWAKSPCSTVVNSRCGRNTHTRCRNSTDRRRSCKPQEKNFPLFWLSPRKTTQPGGERKRITPNTSTTRKRVGLTAAQGSSQILPREQRKWVAPTLVRKQPGHQ